MALTEKEILCIDAETKMKFRDEESEAKWYEIVKTNSEDFYGKSVVRYARRWAKCMQKLIADGKSLSEVAKETSHECDIEGITGFMYVAAIAWLSECWVYGDELRKWHNKNYGYEGEGIVNPTILSANS